MPDTPPNQPTESNETAPSSQPFSADDFRAAMGQFLTGVTIVTGIDAQGHRVGLTANSFNSVSLSPPLVLWSLSKHSSSMPGLLSAKAWAVNILAADQRHLAERFARKGVDRFDGVAWRSGLSGAPLINGAVATFECMPRNHHDEGDHVIFVGEVTHCSRRVGALPLAYHGGRFFTDLPL
jgi:flavin reductase (DIM6/NTAB) family NADH-FMN oxidoreductase RutF